MAIVELPEEAANCNCFLLEWRWYLKVSLFFLTGEQEFCNRFDSRAACESC